MTTRAYYRVSTDQQDADNQARGVRAWAADHRRTIAEEISDTASGSTPWEARPLATLIARSAPGDEILVAEISRLARSTLQVLEIAQAAVAAGVSIIATKSALTIDGSTASKITVTILGLAAEIERDLIRARTTEALAARRAKGLPLGRPVGSRSESKLAKHSTQIEKYLAADIPQAGIARLLGCSRGTVARYLERLDSPTTTQESSPA